MNYIFGKVETHTHSLKTPLPLLFWPILIGIGTAIGSATAIAGVGIGINQAVLQERQAAEQSELAAISKKLAEKQLKILEESEIENNKKKQRLLRGDFDDFTTLPPEVVFNTTDNEMIPMQNLNTGMVTRSMARQLPSNIASSNIASTSFITRPPPVTSSNIATTSFINKPSPAPKFQSPLNISAFQKFENFSSSGFSNPGYVDIDLGTPATAVGGVGGRGINPFMSTTRTPSTSLTLTSSGSLRSTTSGLSRSSSSKALIPTMSSTPGIRLRNLSSQIENLSEPPTPTRRLNLAAITARIRQNYPNRLPHDPIRDILKKHKRKLLIGAGILGGTAIVGGAIAGAVTATLKKKAMQVNESQQSSTSSRGGSFGDLQSPSNSGFGGGGTSFGNTLHRFSQPFGGFGGYVTKRSGAPAGARKRRGRGAGGGGGNRKSKKSSKAATTAKAVGKKPIKRKKLRKHPKRVVRKKNGILKKTINKRKKQRNSNSSNIRKKVKFAIKNLRKAHNKKKKTAF